MWIGKPLPLARKRLALVSQTATVVTVIIAVALGAQLTLPQLLGGLIVFAGVALSSLRSTPSTVDAGPMDASPRITSAKL
jgi:hypothetical protein